MVENYGKRLLTALQARDVSAQKLASHIGVSYQAVRKVLLGQSSALNAFNNSYAARFLRVSSDWLATGSGEMDGDVSVRNVDLLYWELRKFWQAASDEAKEVARFALASHDAPLPPWADKDMLKDLDSMRYAALRWLRSKSEQKKD